MDLSFHIERPESEDGGSWVKQNDDSERYLCARKGEMLSCPFQCDRCWFINLKQEEPSKSFSDKRLLKYIRRANLDVMWSRESSTVKNNFEGVMKNFRRATDLGLKPLATPRGPWPVCDLLGMQICLQILRQSQESGRHDGSYQQFDSIRRLRSAAFNEYSSGVMGLRYGASFTGNGGKAVRISSCPTLSWFFEKFMKGLEKRMGRLVKRDKALDVKILMAIMTGYERELEDPGTSRTRKRFITAVMAYMCVTYSGGLRGGEGFLLEASALCELIEEGRSNVDTPHVLAPLLGKFKNEVGECKMLFALASTTESRIPNRRSLERLSRVLTAEGRHLFLGPAICDSDGICITRTRMNSEFHRALERVQNKDPELIAPDINVKEIYNIHRSFRRGATSRATAKGVSEADINFNNRWGNAQRIRGRHLKFKMSELYVDIKLAVQTYLRFSSSL